MKIRNNLSVKKPQSVEFVRRNAQNPWSVYGYFDTLESEFLRLNLKPENVYNCDETSFSNDPSKTRIIGAKGEKATRTTHSTGRENTKVLTCCSASGNKLPLLVVFKGKNIIESWIDPEDKWNTAISVAEKGWMNGKLFLNWFKEVFLKNLPTNQNTLTGPDRTKISRAFFRPDDIAAYDRGENRPTTLDPVISVPCPNTPDVLVIPGPSKMDLPDAHDLATPTQVLPNPTTPNHVQQSSFVASPTTPDTPTSFEDIIISMVSKKRPTKDEATKTSRRRICTEAEIMTTPAYLAKLKEDEAKKLEKESAKKKTKKCKKKARISDVSDSEGDDV